MLVMSKSLTNVSNDQYDIETFNKICKVLQNNELDYFEIDNKRQISKKEKKQVWNESICHELFDYKIFRLDILGLVCINRKILLKHLNKKNEVFNYEFEHILSHCHGGQSTIDNIAILNKSINRDKKSKELYKYNYNEVLGLCYNKMNFIDLLYKLKNNLHETCLEYNLYFVRKNKYWTINDNFYNNEYKNNILEYIKENPEILKINLKINQKLIKENLKKLREKEPLSEKLYDDINNNIEIIMVCFICTGIGYTTSYLYNLYKSEKPKKLSNELIKKVQEQTNIQNEHYKLMIKYNNLINESINDENNIYSIKMCNILLDEIETTLDKISIDIFDIKKMIKLCT